TFPLGINAGASVSDWWIGRSPLIQGGISWKNESTKADFLSSYLIAANVGFKDNVQKLHAGGEVFLLDEHLGLRAGFRYGSDSLSGFSPTLGLTLRTHRVEKTDFELHYGFLFTDAESSGSLHQFGLNVLFGDARKSEKDSIIAVQAERARKLKEQTLAREIEELRDELVKVAEERSALQEERADIERLREQALADLDRVKGVDVREDSTGIRITLLETSLRFAPGSAKIPFPEGFRTLDRTAGLLSQYPNAEIQIKVHTDNSPVPEESQDKFPDNLSLSKARARQIKKYLVDVEGFSATGVYAEGVGDAEPAQDNETPEGDAVDERVEVILFK
ncbi:OmpA family protein, partial [candidate division WOR-3 bacterium]|nr:OmpA family protein [candidate division WOR-3 bacterium]